MFYSKELEQKIESLNQTNQELKNERDKFKATFKKTEESLNHQIKVMPLHSEQLTDCFISGVQFNKKNEDICVTCYDNNDIVFYKMK